MSMTWLTVQDMLDRLQKVKNKNACVVLCELGREYEPFSRVFDETRKTPDYDGNIGVVSFALSRYEEDRKKWRKACQLYSKHTASQNSEAKKPKKKR